MNYRPEIDGLRALAVIPVILYHAGVGWMPGGFVGVDIFFVISGYLISAGIFHEVADGNFNFLKFYERRLRRIFPALIVVLLITISAFQLIGTPDQAVNTAASGLASLLSVGNFWFWQASGYFAPATEFMPLLHTWSLSVEEQFYFIFPLIIFALSKSRIPLKYFIIVSLIFSFLISVWLSFNKPSVAYYLLPSRAWEMLLGAALAAGIVPAPRSRWISEAATALGLGLIIFSVLCIRSDMVFPGWVAVIPCLGAAFVIYAGGTSFLASRFLATPFVVFVGVISYSLYLIHWPALTALRTYNGSTFLNSPSVISCLAFIFLLSCMLWYFVERPFRTRLLFPSRRLLVWTGSGAALVIGIAIISIVMEGFPGRLSEQAKAALSLAEDAEIAQSACRGIHDLAQCRLGNQDAEVTFAIIGDSHAPPLRYAFEASGFFGDAAGTVFWMEGCPLLSGLELSPECTQFQNGVWEVLSSQAGIETVVLAGRWPYWTTGTAPEHMFLRTLTLLKDEQTTELTVSENSNVVRRSLLRTIARLRELGIRTVVVGSLPEPVFDVPVATAMALMTGRETPQGIPRKDVAARAGAADDLIGTAIVDEEGTRFVSVWKEFCVNEWCDTARKGLPLFFDDDHLSESGAVMVVAPALNIIK